MAVLSNILSSFLPSSVSSLRRSRGTSMVTALLGSVSLAFAGCAPARQSRVIDCWELPTAALAAAAQQGQCTDAFGRYIESIEPQAAPPDLGRPGSAADRHTGAEGYWPPATDTDPPAAAGSGSSAADPASPAAGSSGTAGPASSGTSGTGNTLGTGSGMAAGTASGVAGSSGVGG